ncbi:MAG TPA: hypothetical protein VHF22_06035 [Planctomycetota bacterium]|nr:hypothetical protein [Planctomycetota bacterium]
MATRKNPERQSHGTTYRPAAVQNPAWWSNEYDSGWDRVKEAFRRDWEQTKNDLSFGKAGKDLNQDVPDTVKQAAGSKPVPPGNAPNVDEDWARNEPAFRYGFGARTYYKDFGTWNGDLETRLKTEYTGLGRSWEQDRDLIRHGYDYRRI